MSGHEGKIEWRMSMTEKMKAIVFTEQKKVEIMEIDKPKITASELLIASKALSICTVEQRTFKNSNRYPMIGGHEVSAVVVEVGEDVRGYEVGDKVVSTFQYCGYCENCKKGIGQKCLNSRTQKKRILHQEINVGNGGMAQYAAVPATQVCKVGKDLPFHIASLTEPLGCCINSIEKVDVKYGETAVVIGAGVMGLLHTKLLRMKGARVIVSEVDEKRRKISLNTGANYAYNPVEVDGLEYIKELTDGKGADIVVNTTSIYQVGEDAIKLLAPYGRYIAYASLHPAVPIPLDFNEVHHKETQIIGTVSPRAIDFLMAAKLMEYGLIDMADIVHQIFPFEDAQEAFEQSIVPGTYRCIISFE